MIAIDATHSLWPRSDTTYCPFAMVVTSPPPRLTRSFSPTVNSSRTRTPQICAASLGSIFLLVGMSSACSKALGDVSGTRGTQEQSKTMGQPSEQQAANVVDLTPTQFRDLQNEKAGIFLDVRTPGEVSQAHLSGASVVDFRDPNFQRKVGSMQKDKPVFVYCASGNRSARASKQLISLGFRQIYNLKGGMHAWKDAGFAVERSAIKAVGKKGSTLTPAAFDKLLATSPIVLVDFHTQWCAPCLEMIPIIDALEVQYQQDAQIKRIDIDTSEALAKREMANGVPVFVLYEKGKETWRHSGPTSQQNLAQRLAGAIAALTPTP